MESLIGGLIGLVVAFIIVKFLDWLCDGPQKMDEELHQQLKESGWSEDAIREFIDEHFEDYLEVKDFNWSEDVDDFIKATKERGNNE